MRKWWKTDSEREERDIFFFVKEYLVWNEKEKRTGIICYCTKEQHLGKWYSVLWNQHRKKKINYYRIFFYTYYVYRKITSFSFYKQKIIINFFKLENIFFLFYLWGDEFFFIQASHQHFCNCIPVLWFPLGFPFTVSHSPLFLSLFCVLFFLVFLWFVVNHTLFHSQKNFVKSQCK